MSGKYQNLATSQADENQIITLHEAGIDIHTVARIVKMPTVEIRRVIMEHTARKAQTAKDLLAQVNIGKALELEGDNFMITCDWHVPQTDWRLVERLVIVAEKQKIRRLIIAGDFFDQNQFSRYAAVIPPTPWAFERDTAREIMAYLLEVFDEIIITMGNHDRRLITWADASLDLKDVWGSIIENPRVTISKFGYSTIKTSRMRENGLPLYWRPTHPKNYAQQRGKVGVDVAEKYDMSVMTAHEHHTAITTSKSGRHWVVNLGGLYDPAKIAYAQLDDNTSPVMSPSFGMLLDGYPYVFADGLTDWGKWGC